jgi:trehalose synthase
VFALSGWDLVGALTLPQAAVRDRLADGDTRWINRGAYDLIGANPRAQVSSAGLPRATAIYGSLPEQLKHPDSFASQLARMLKARAAMRLYAARLAELPKVRTKSLLVLVHELPDDAGLEITAVNFGNQPVDEMLVVQSAPVDAKATDALDPKASPLEVGEGHSLRVKLDAYEYKALLIKQ